MQIGILGAGTMGHGIAQVSAMAGHNVVVRDIRKEFVDSGIEAIESNLDGGIERGKVTKSEKRAALANLSGTTDLRAAVENANLVIEAVPEEASLKKDTFREIEEFASKDCTIASNTSSISVTEIASVLSHPSRAVGLHFFNPVHIMALVEVVRAEQTDTGTRAIAESFVEDIGKTPIVVNDSPGFASSRLGVTLGVEAIRMVEEGVTSPEDIDAAMELGYNHPMGPIKLGDVVGLDVRLDILEYLREELGERFRPPQILKQKVRAGKLGRKTGEGFYVWQNGETVGTSGDWDRGE